MFEGFGKGLVKGSRNMVRNTRERLQDKQRARRLKQSGLTAQKHSPSAGGSTSPTATTEPDTRTRKARILSAVKTGELSVAQALDQLEAKPVDEQAEAEAVSEQEAVVHTEAATLEVAAGVEQALARRGVSALNVMSEPAVKSVSGWQEMTEEEQAVYVEAVAIRLLFARKKQI